MSDLATTPDRLLTISVDGYRPGYNRPGMCLRWNYFAYGLTPNKTPAAIAMDAWNFAPAEHRHPITATTVVPRGLPIILGPSPTRTDANRSAGDVFPADGQGAGMRNLGGMTDSPLLGTGRIGRATLGQRAAQTRRPVLGYLTWWLGYVLSTDGTATPTPAIPGLPPVNPMEGEEMSATYANTDTNVWSIGRPGKFDAVPSGMGDQALAESHQTQPIRANSAQIAWWSDYWKHQQETLMYACADGPEKDRYFVIGPRTQHVVQPSELAYLTVKYGNRIVVSAAELAIIRNLNQIGA